MGINRPGSEVDLVDQALLDEFCAECGLTGPVRIEVTPKGESASEVHLLRQPFLIVGRRADSDLMLDHWLVSRRHAYLQLIEGRFYCVDLGSRTGTHGGDATERSGWLDPTRPIQVGPFAVRPSLSGPPAHDYPPLPIVTWQLKGQRTNNTRWSMSRSLVLVGRSFSCRIRLHGPDISRFHCALVLTRRGVWVVDLLSHRPVLVNDQPVRFARVEPGDELRVGSHVLVPHYDMSLIQDAGSLQPSGETFLAPQELEVPESDADQLPALTPTLVVPSRHWNSLNTTSEPTPAFSGDPTVSNLVQQFGAMQQQMFDQFHQTMMMMFEGFATLHRETSGSIRAEVEEVRKLSDEIDQLREETARLAEATTMSFQQSALDRTNHLQGQAPRNGQPGGATSPVPAAPKTPPKVTPAAPDPHVDIHAELCNRLNSISAERQNRWQKILALMSRS